MITGDAKRIKRTDKETDQIIMAILGKYCNLIFNLRKVSLTKVEIMVIIKNKPIPTIGPVATKTTDNAAGKNIPKPRIPIS